MNFKFYLLTLLSCFLCLMSGARKLHSYSLTGRLGIVPFSTPSDAKHLSDPNVKASMLGGLRLAYEDRIAQIGLSLDVTKLTYDNPFTTTMPFLNPGITVNFKINPGKKFLFAGVHGGLIIPAGEDPVSHTLSPGLGFSYGAQSGGELMLAPHLYATAEAGFRYGFREVTELKDQWFFYFPVVIGLKYQFGKEIITNLR